MPQPTDLFCHTIFFVKLNICTSLQILREYIPPHDFLVQQGHSVSIKYGQTFFSKLFIADGGEFVGEGGGEGGRGACSTWGIDDQIMPRVGEFQKCIFQ